MSWLCGLLPALRGTSGRTVADALLRVGLEVERVESLTIASLRVGRVHELAEELQRNGKTIRWCQVDVGEVQPRGIVCGAANFSVGDRVVVALPGAVLPGGFAIARRKTYGHSSDGMICSARELGLGDEHSGILVLDPAAPVGADASALLELDDEVLDIAVTPDRGYALSVRGIARETAASLDLTFVDPGLIEPGLSLPPGVQVELHGPGCDRYVAVTVDGVNPTARTPPWLSRRLERAGMRAISLAVDITNYVQLELGQPLHAFDADLVNGHIVVRRAQDGESLCTLDGTVRALATGDLVIADSSGPIALAGVMGGAATEISATTTRVLIESAHFDPASIARTVRRHRLPSEASRRFERGVDPALGPVAAAAAATLLAEFGAGRPVACTDVDNRVPSALLLLPGALPGTVGGRPIAVEAVAQQLITVGCTVEVAEPLRVQAPSWRPDLTEPIDLVEEVLRLEGYETLPSLLAPASGGSGLTDAQRRRRAVSRALAAAGFVEVLSSPFVASNVLGLPLVDVRRREVAVLNPLSAQESVLRTSLLPALCAALARNVARGYSDVALFELGVVFRDSRGESVVPPAPSKRPSDDILAALNFSLPEQPHHVAVVMTGAAEPAGWWGPGRGADWSDVVAIAQQVGAAVGLVLSLEVAAEPPWHPGRCASLALDGTLIGHAGELHPEACERLGVPPRSCAAELDLGVLLSASSAAVRAPELLTFPASTVDVALLVDELVPQAAVAAALRDGAGPLLESLTLFDVYTGPPVPAGRRSLAYTLRFRAPGRTLTGDEVLTARDAAVRSATVASGAVLRI